MGRSGVSRGRPAVWCDFAGVLTVPVADTFTGFCATVGVAPPHLMAAMSAVARQFGTDDIMEPLDTPLVDGAEWLRRVESVLERDFGTTVDLSDFAALWFAGRPPNAEMVNYLENLRAEGIFVGMVSNMPPDFDPYWRTVVNEEMFDAVVLSCHVGCRKPDRAIYDLCARTADAEASACVLIDDLPINCLGAREIGWTAVEFRDAADALARVEEAIRR